MKSKQNRFLNLVLFLAIGVLVLGTWAPVPLIAADEEVELPESISAEVDKVLEQAMQGGFRLTVEGWPEGKVPPEVPPYSRGKVVNSGGSPEEYTILVETNRDELQEYLEELEDLGWYVDYDPDYPTTRLRNISLWFQFNSKTLMQMDVYVEELGTWPEGELPADIFPPEKGLLIGNVQIYDQSDDGFHWYIRYEYDGLGEQDVMDYMEQFMEQGWSGDEYMIKKSIEWNGSTFDASMEPWWDEGAVSFDFNLFKQD